jgi:stress response protein SCP2
MEATLIGPYGQTTLEPTPYPYTIGQSPDNRIVLNDLNVSSHHAQIRLEGPGYEIIDLGSRNGTFVNEQRLVPNLPRLLYTGDQIRIGDTRFTYEAGTMTQLPMKRTVYGGFNEESNLSSAPQTSVPPSIEESYGPSQGGYASYPQAVLPTKKPRRLGLWIALGGIVGVLLLSAIAFGALGYVNRSTPTKTLNAFCNALKIGDYPTAYNQLSSGLQAKFTSEAAFKAGFSNNGGLGKITNCTISNVDDGVGTGTISYVLTGGSASKLVVDYTLIDENGSWKINAQQFISTPTETLLTYCTSLKNQDYQTAYDQLSNSQHSQQTEAQFVANFNGIKVTDCKVTNVNDTAGTGTINYTLSNGRSTVQIVLDYTLVKENGTWKINTEQKHA